MPSRPDAHPIVPGLRGQLGLRGMLLWVFAAALAAGLLRGSELRLSGPGTGLATSRVVGALLTGIALGAAIALVVSFAKGFRAETRTGWLGRVWAFLWRAAAVGILLAAVVEERRLLGPDPSTLSRIGTSQDMTYRLYIEPTRLDLYPIGLALLLIGLILGLDGVRSTPSARGGGRSLFVVLAVAAGLLLMINPEIQAVPYLVLLVLQGVSAARHRPSHADLARPGLFRRLDHAGVAAAIGGVLLIAVALWLARDYRRGRSEAIVSWRWFFSRSLAILAVVSVGVELCWVEVPLLDPSFASGFALVLGRNELTAIVLGFFALSAGLASRALASSEDRPAGRRGWASRAGKSAIVATILALFGLHALHWVATSARISLYDPAGAPRWLNAAIHWIDKVDFHIFERNPVGELLRASIVPDRLIWILILAWISLRFVSLTLRGRLRRHVPLDSVADSPATFARFLWLSIGLTAVCLAAMPTFLLLGVSLFHLRLHGGDLFGWPI